MTSQNYCSLMEFQDTFLLRLNTSSIQFLLSLLTGKKNKKNIKSQRGGFECCFQLKIWFRRVGCILLLKLLWSLNLLSLSQYYHENKYTHVQLPECCFYVRRGSQSQPRTSVLIIYIFFIPATFAY